MNSTTLKPSGEAFLYTFPFLIYVDTTSQLEAKEINFNGKPVRIYPFFRSGKANFLPMPQVNIRNIPFIDRLNVKIPINTNIPLISAIPSLERDADGNFQMLVNFSENFEKVPKIMPMDSLRIDVLDKNISNVDVSNNCSLQIIQLVRHKTKQWWLEHYTNAYLLKATFSILRNGFPLDKPYSQAKGRTIIGDETPINENIWEEAISELEQGKINPLYTSLILDARYFEAVSDFRRAILDATIACEQTRDVHFERLWNLHKGFGYRKGKLTGNNLPVHLSKDLLKITNNAHSYEEEYPEYFDIIKDLWNLRGEIAHGRPLQFFKNGVLQNINEFKTKEFIACVEHCINWLENL